MDALISKLYMAAWRVDTTSAHSISSKARSTSTLMSIAVEEITGLKRRKITQFALLVSPVTHMNGKLPLRYSMLSKIILY